MPEKLKVANCSVNFKKHSDLENLKKYRPELKAYAAGELPEVKENLRTHG